MYTFTPGLPHGEIEAIFPNLYFVTGTSRPNFQGMVWQFSRNMTIVREGDSLTLINSVRLNDDGLRALDQLGQVKHVVKLGAFHGIDDAFYVDRYRARLWALPGMRHESGLPTDGELTPGGPMPFADVSLFAFETVKQPEGILHIHQHGGILVACDSLQNWAEPDRFFSPETAALMRSLGFIRTANVGPGWRQFAEPQASDFARLSGLSFRHLLSAHGTPLLDQAHALLSQTFREQFGI